MMVDAVNRPNPAPQEHTLVDAVMPPQEVRRSTLCSSIQEISDPEIRRETGLTLFVVAQAKVRSAAGEPPALEFMKGSWLPGRVGLVENESGMLILAIGCKDSHGSMAKQACETVAREFGGGPGYRRSFGGGLFTVEENGAIEIFGTSGDLHAIKSERLKEFAAVEIARFMRSRMPEA